jgi:hypothetical protein
MKPRLIAIRVHSIASCVLPINAYAPATTGAADSTKLAAFVNPGDQ